jgi:protein-S-isoprenylcysteine O-methyltransferase Ste14
MSLDNLQFVLILTGIVVAVGVFVALFFISAPYGRHARHGFGPMIPNHLSWMIMETPSVVLFAVLFALGSAPKNLPIMIFFVLWELHYVHRAFIYPWTIRDGRKKMPIVVIMLGFAFNIGNSYANGRYLFTHSGAYPASWLLDYRFLTGTTLFLAGFVINRWADSKLRALREPGDVSYSVPNGGLFNWISCPNYLGEIIEWTGWALATWCLPGLAFTVWTFANLAPRARSHHAWYHTNFPEYPQQRKALIPWVW